MHDPDEEIREIKREIIESRGLTIKTNNLVNALGADIKSIQKRQVGYERRFKWNGGVFLFAIAIITFVAVKLASDARIGEIETEMERLRADARELEAQLETETQRAREREQAERAAARYYALIREQEREEVVELYGEVTQEELSRAEEDFFRDTYDRFRLDLSIEQYQSGLELIRNGRFAEAAEKFQQSIRLRDDSAHIPQVKYQLARALRRLGRQSEAIVYAQQVVEQEVDRDLQPDAVYLVALCAEELDDLDTAREALGTLIRRWPRSQLAREARPLFRDITRRALRGGSSESADG